MAVTDGFRIVGSWFLVLRIWPSMPPCPGLYNANGAEERQLIKFQPFGWNNRSHFWPTRQKLSLKCSPPPAGEWVQS